MALKPIHESIFGSLYVSVYKTNEELGLAAAEKAAHILREAVRTNGEANVILATGNSQLTFLEAMKDMLVNWTRVNFFHMDEYVGLDPSHPASFPLFLRSHFINSIHPKAFFPIPPSTLANAEEISTGYENLLDAYQVDLCVMGIGENGHLAFNDPPYARFDDPRRVKIVRLDVASRRQQVGEGHFKTLEEVPTHAITLTIPALLASKQVLVLVPEARKAAAVERSLMGPITEDCPASVLRQASHAHLYLDINSAGKIS